MRNLKFVLVVYQHFIAVKIDKEGVGTTLVNI